MFNSNFFGNDKVKRNSIDFKDANIVFVADLFTDEYSGGAELTTEALFETSTYKTSPIFCG